MLHVITWHHYYIAYATLYRQTIRHLIVNIDIIHRIIQRSAKKKKKQGRVRQRIAFEKLADIVVVIRDDKENMSVRMGDDEYATREADGTKIWLQK